MLVAKRVAKQINPTNISIELRTAPLKSINHSKAYHTYKHKPALIRVEFIIIKLQSSV